MPTLSSLSRINDCVRPRLIHEHVGLTYARAWHHTHAHTPTASHTLPMSHLHRHYRPPPCHIYPSQCGGEDQLLLVSNKRATSEWGEAPPFLPTPSPPFPSGPLVSLQMKWTNAKSMFLLLLMTMFNPLPHCFLADLKGIDGHHCHKHKPQALTLFS